MVRKVLNILFTVALTAVLIFLGAFVFRSSYVRLWQGIKDFGLSVGFYFCSMFKIQNGIVPTVSTIPEVQTPQVTLPTDIDGFKDNTVSYFSLLFNGDNFRNWLVHISGIIVKVSKTLIIILPCIVILIFAIKALYRKENTNHGKETVPLRVFKAISKWTYQPIKQFVRGYAAFIKENKWILICWIIMSALNFNLATIAVEFFAYYFYFAVVFDFGTVYTQFVKLFADLKTPFVYFPWWTLLFAIYPLLDKFRRRIATGKLRHYEARNCGFINELPIVSLTCGSMGKKKTTAITDMALSQEVMFRQKALDILQRGDMKFSMFPWILFEKAMQAEIESGRIYNLATVKCWVISLEERGELFGYDSERYGLEYDNGLSVENIYDVLSTYAQAYFIYIIESSLIVSNYSIREDNLLIDSGNFPVWLTDFFPTNFRRSSRHAHILDFDILRLGKKVLENNPNAGSFEFGVIGITEIGKERGNNLELQEKKKSAEEANQKNDKFNSWLKMCRHSATVDNFPFIKVFADEQRPESWGADARDLCDIVNIASSSEQKLAMPFYTIGDMIAEWAFNRFIGLYYDFRFRRGDNTLLVHVFKSVTVWLWKRNIRIYNRYGYSVLSIEKERGTMDGKVQRKKYYLMNAKIYRKRFATDCFADYFNDMALRTNVGLNDYREYLTECASVDELQAQNSYFINALYGDVSSQPSILNTEAVTGIRSNQSKGGGS